MAKQTAIIEHLNIVLGNELVAINQYFLHSKILKSQGINKLAELHYHESIEEMKHAEALTERVLLLKGLPNLQYLGKLSIGENIHDILRADHALEIKAIADLRTAIQMTEKQEDFVSGDLLLNILSVEEKHIEWLEAQLNLVETLGEQNYLQTQI